MSNLLRFLFPPKSYSFAASWLLLAARVAFGLALMTHGVAKWSHFELLATTFPDPLGTGSPTALRLAIFAELFCAAGVVSGALYRLALLPVLFTMGIAAFVALHGEPFAVREPAILYLCAFALLFAAGPGDFAVDRILGPRFSRNRNRPDTL